jgi:hypothetical protein
MVHACLSGPASVMPARHMLRHTHHEPYCCSSNPGSTACIASVCHRNHTSTAARQDYLHGPGVPTAVDARPQALQEVSTCRRTGFLSVFHMLTSSYPFLSTGTLQQRQQPWQQAAGT